jgi:hypothetical protein
MERSPQEKSDSQCFELFSTDPKGVSIEIVQGAHKFIANVIKNDENGPTCQTLIKIFSEFTKKPIKDYVFTRMTKPILLELALCIIQDLVLNGPERRHSLEIELTKSKSGGKLVRVADPFEDDGKHLDPDFLKEIDEAFFKLKDADGKSPDVVVTAGQGHKASYSPFAKDGAFVRPGGLVPRSLELPLEVVPPLRAKFTKFDSYSLLAGGSI